MNAARKAIFAILAVCFSGLLFARNGAPSAPKKEIALTFDDELRAKVLYGESGLFSVLRANRAKATFFTLGWQAAAHPELFRDVASRGFEIENHTWGHENLVSLEKKSGGGAVIANIEKTSRAIEKAAGRYPRFFRPPYWVINARIKAAIETRGYRVMRLGNPDVNSLDYDDYEHHRPASVLADRVLRDIRRREALGAMRHVLVFHEEPGLTVPALVRLLPILSGEGYRFVTLEEFYGEGSEARGRNVAYVAETRLPESRAPRAPANNVHALYLSVDDIHSERKIRAIERIFETTDANAVVIDYKVDREAPQGRVKMLLARFKELGVYTIARIVVMQDSYLARRDPSAAIRRRDGGLWWSGRAAWHRYWVDPASSAVLERNTEIASHAADLGFDEINFDYLRFPTDGNLSNMAYPVYDPRTMRKTDVMERFFGGLTGSLKRSHPGTVLSIDIFGEVAEYGGVKGIGQELSTIGEYFDVVCPMAYPSHYRCGEFGFHDPTAHPYEVYAKTMAAARKILPANRLRPWIQAFTIPSIYACGPTVSYDSERIREEIGAGTDLGIGSFMLWNAASNYAPAYFDKK